MPSSSTTGLLKQVRILPPIKGSKLSLLSEKGPHLSSPLADKALKPTWRQILRQNFVSVEKLADFLELSLEDRNQLLLRPRFAFNLPLRLALKIEKKTLNDPILRQFVPLQEELLEAPGFSKAPVQDENFFQAPRLLQKYAHRSLLITTGACAMHCRYCFRQNFEYPQGPKDFTQEIEKFRTDPSLQEAILSGGDPLSLPDDTLSSLLLKLADIPHLRRIRFHTRFLVGIPERVTEAFLAVLKAVKKPIIFVLHINHPREWDQDIANAIQSLRSIGISFLNQAVLLKGVNDDVETLKELMNTLCDAGVMPYYLHKLDPVQGASHFDVSKEEGKSLISSLQKELPGYAVPRFVQEIPKEPNKTHIL